MLERWRLDGPSRRTVAKDRLGLQGRLTYASPPLDVVWETLIQVYSLHVTRLFLSVFCCFFLFAFCFGFDFLVYLLGCLLSITNSCGIRTNWTRLVILMSSTL